MGARRVSIFGSTGSIGRQALQCIAAAPEQFSVEVLTAHHNYQLLAKQAIACHARQVIISNEAHYPALKDLLAGSGIIVHAGRQALIDAGQVSVDLALHAIVGAAGLEPVFASLSYAKMIGLANKETLVCAGRLLMQEAEKAGTKILPVDSEHTAVIQCLEAENHDAVHRIGITASGGPFWFHTQAQLKQVKREEALKHPNFSMGAKITVDSATLMNKSFELIESVYLYDVPQEKVEVVIHPEQVLHGYVQYVDGITMAQMSVPDMLSVIGYILHWPKRPVVAVEPLNMMALNDLTFFPQDDKRFPALKLARNVIEQGGIAPLYFNVANEVAVEHFLQDKLHFLDIVNTVDAVLQALPSGQIELLSDIKTHLEEARRFSETMILRHSMNAA